MAPCIVLAKQNGLIGWAENIYDSFSDTANQRWRIMNQNGPARDQGRSDVCSHAKIFSHAYTTVLSSLLT